MVGENPDFWKGGLKFEHPFTELYKEGHILFRFLMMLARV